MNITRSQFHIIGKLLDATSVRQRVIAENIANVNTPGYQRQEVQFEQELVRLLEENNQPISDRDLESVSPRVITTRNLPQRADGNNVDIEMEMGQLTRKLDAAGIAHDMNFAGSAVLVPKQRYNEARVAAGDALAAISVQRIDPVIILRRVVVASLVVGIVIAVVFQCMYQITNASR